ncbi:hypothetical protein AB0F17_53750 [Nonomuraea sp. NPDC026600]|uniref:hypothetical protein n=1 Tax=Nonomuraea sp. NPDC026600 TaxID=3155363 RepID=UPI0033EFE146
MKIWKSLLISALVLVTTTLGLTTPASAAGAMGATVPAQAASTQNPGKVVATHPAAPADARTRSLAAASPGMSPAPGRNYHSDPGSPWVCASQWLCIIVWDYSVGKWEDFELLSCNRYGLSNWEDTGYFLDNQTNNVLSTFYDQGSNVLRTFRPDNQVHDQYWSPVWSIRNC